MPLVKYKFSFDEGDEVEISVDTERSPLPLKVTSDKPHWLRLSHHQCPNCPLALSADACCPAASDIEDIVSHFSHVESYAQVNIEVDLGGKTLVKRTEIQNGLRSLLGLVLATSACPVLSQMKGPGRLHTPFANVEETAFRMVGAYFVGQYLKSCQGQTPDYSLEALSDMYRQVQTVNRHLVKRLEDAVYSDANVNAIVSLMSVSMLVSFSLEQQIEDLEPFSIVTTPYPSCEVQS